MATLITGESGSLGKELKKVFPNSLCPSHSQLDIINKKDVFEFFKKNDIDLVIHAAALTKIRPCEENRQQAWKTNVEGTKNLVDAVLDSKPNIPFIFISTACVFDGHSGMYTESSIPYPENFYALTKLVGEHEVNKLSNYLIIRTNFVSKKNGLIPKHLLIGLEHIFLRGMLQRELRKLKKQI